MRFTVLFSLGLGLLAVDSAVAGPGRPGVTGRQYNHMAEEDKGLTFYSFVVFHSSRVHLGRRSDNLGYNRRVVFHHYIGRIARIFHRGTNIVH
ncbi:hypothetical protein QQZ08_009238 [Neonectria magnoliae]|uniref:Uncharacterized protein n=1 Tax=Neonectria magnoliae TaxID=2732573 RepID=A0ABR1HPG4_9HYPO